MTEKFTPGPWVKDYNGTIGHIKSTGVPERNATPTVARYDAFAELYTNGRDWPSLPKAEEQANARLIAAAPDLYEALEAVLGVMKHQEPRPQHQPIAMFKARAALARVKGEAE